MHNIMYNLEYYSVMHACQAATDNFHKYIVISPRSLDSHINCTDIHMHYVEYCVPERCYLG